MKKAFTLLELIFVIVVVGILAAVVVPSTNRNPVLEAGIQILSHIRYTQHLAMVSDKYDANNTQWYLGRWQIAFSNANNTTSYMIFSERQGAYNGNPDATNNFSSSEVAKNPQNPQQFLIGTADANFANNDTSRLSTELDIGKKYGIAQFRISGGATGSTSLGVIFDSMGRPYRGNTDDTVLTVIHSPQDRLTSTAMFIKICSNTCTGGNNTANNENELVIRIEPETGYAHIL